MSSYWMEQLVLVSELMSFQWLNKVHVECVRLKYQNISIYSIFISFFFVWCWLQSFDYSNKEPLIIFFCILYVRDDVNQLLRSKSRWNKVVISWELHLKEIFFQVKCYTLTTFVLNDTLNRQRKTIESNLAYILRIINAKLHECLLWWNTLNVWCTRRGSFVFEF